MKLTPTQTIEYTRQRALDPSISTPRRRMHSALYRFLTRCRSADFRARVRDQQKGLFIDVEG